HHRDLDARCAMERQRQVEVVDARGFEAHPCDALAAGELADELLVARRIVRERRAPDLALDRHRDLGRAHIDPDALPPAHCLLRGSLLPGSPTLSQRLPVLWMQALGPRILLGMGVEGGGPI